MVKRKAAPFLIRRVGPPKSQFEGRVTPPFGIFQTLERRSGLYLDYTVPLLEKLTAAARQGPQIYF